MMTNKYALIQSYNQYINKDDAVFKEILKNLEPFGGNYSGAQSAAISTSITEASRLI